MFEPHHSVRADFLTQTCRFPPAKSAINLSRNGTSRN